VSSWKARSTGETRHGDRNSAATLDALRSPPGNRLEALLGDLKDQHSIRINDQFRLCFVWGSDGVHDVKVVDYH